jgi:hypothetical protein
MLGVECIFKLLIGLFQCAVAKNRKATTEKGYACHRKEKERKKAKFK